MEHKSHSDLLLKLNDFDYPCPQHLIAQEPIADRSASRLLVRYPDGSTKDLHVSDLTTELSPNSLLIFNESRVFPSRVLGQLGTGGSIEIFLLREICDAESPTKSVWEALGRPMKKLKPNTVVHFNPNLTATIMARYDDNAGNGLVKLAFDVKSNEFHDWLERFGYVPLPPYIKRVNPTQAENSPDKARYQTVYARETGSVAAPTAGLHFTSELLENLKNQGVELRFVSLHVGAGTFLPVKTENIADHVMHSELYKVGAETAAAIIAAKRDGRKVIAVGTTTFRSLESLYQIASGDPEKFTQLANHWHSTDLFLRPQSNGDTYTPWVIDGLFTNFHQPCSTLFMLISAIIGLEAAKATYATAVSREYRLFSYGDANLLWL